MQRHIRIAITILVAALACGCVTSNPVYYSTLNPELTYSGRCRVAVAVHDARSRVIKGETSQSSVGEVASSSMKRVPLTTASERPLSEITADALIKVFSQKGFDVVRIRTTPTNTSKAILDKVNNAGADHGVVITINEWWSSVLKNADLVYDLTLVLYDSKGDVLLEVSEKGNKAFGQEVGDTAKTSTEDLGWGAAPEPSDPAVEEPVMGDQDAFAAEATTTETVPATEETETATDETEAAKEEPEAAKEETEAATDEADAATDEADAGAGDLNNEIFLFYQQLVGGMLNDPRMPKLMNRFDTGKTQEKPSPTAEPLAPAGSF